MPVTVGLLCLSCVLCCLSFLLCPSSLLCLFSCCAWRGGRAVRFLLDVLPVFASLSLVSPVLLVVPFPLGVPVLLGVPFLRVSSPAGRCIAGMLQACGHCLQPAWCLCCLVHLTPRQQGQLLRQALSQPLLQGGHSQPHHIRGRGGGRGRQLPQRRGRRGSGRAGA